MNEVAARYRAKNRTRLNEASKAYYHANKVEILGKKNYRAISLKKFGLTIEDYDRMLAAQDGGCAICGTTENTRKPGVALPVDHCHETGTVRGILCDDCNLMLGYAGDDVERLKRAITYLGGDAV